MNPFAAILHLFTSMLFLGFGSILLGFFAFEPARLKLIELLTREPDYLVLAGAAVLSVGVLLILGFYSAHRGKFLVVRMGERKVVVDAKVVASTLKPLFQKQFGQRLELLSVGIGAKGFLEIALRFAPQIDAEQTLTLIESELQLLLAQRFGYKKPFKVIVGAL
ncbi:MAG TPA: hypothetical protein VGM34_03350 [Chlamydiales bacterium]